MHSAPLRFRLIRSFHQKHHDINLVAHVYSKMFISGFHASTKMIIEKSEDKVNLHIRKKSFGTCGEGEKSTECVPGRRNLSTRKRIPLDMLPKCPLWLCFHPPGEHLRRIYLRRLQVDEKKKTISPPADSCGFFHVSKTRMVQGIGATRTKGFTII